MTAALEKPWGNGRGPGIIPCLSMQQPFATALVFGPKDAENRGRCVFKVPPGGLWVAIHASKTDYGSNAATRERVYHDMLALWPERPPASQIPRAAIIGVVFFDWAEQYDVVTAGGLDPVVDARLALLDASEWAFPGSYCYHVAERRPLATPVPALGALGLWGAPPGVAAAIREQLPGLWSVEGTP